MASSGPHSDTRAPVFPFNTVDLDEYARRWRFDHLASSPVTVSAGTYPMPFTFTDWSIQTVHTLTPSYDTGVDLCWSNKSEMLYYFTQVKHLQAPSSVREIRRARYDLAHELAHHQLAYDWYLQSGAAACYVVLSGPSPENGELRGVSPRTCDRLELPAAEEALRKISSANESEFPNASHRWLIPSTFLSVTLTPNSASNGTDSFTCGLRLLSKADKHLDAIERLLRNRVAALQAAIAMLTVLLIAIILMPVTVVTVTRVILVRYHRNSREPADAHHAPMRRCQPSAGGDQAAH